jgi:hypothetical protein
MTETEKILRTTPLNIMSLGLSVMTVGVLMGLFIGVGSRPWI